MKVTENVTVYKCDFCKKKLFRKHAMVLHEKWCTYNHANHMKCMGCKNLEVGKFEWSNEHGAHTTSDLLTSSNFKCKVTGKEMFPIKALKKNLPTKYPHDFENKVVMPKECNVFVDAYPKVTDDYFLL